jgi:HK97 gp10 family phage protein
MQISITFNPSLDALAKSFSSVDVGGVLKDEIQKLAFRIERNAKQLTPVDTGRLRASILTQPMFGGFGAKVSTNTDYAIFVHEGTRYMRARPFMSEGLNQLKDGINKGILDRVDEEFAKAFKKL